MSQEVMNEANAWVEWKEKCDIKKCSKENRDILNFYGDKILSWQIEKFSFGKLRSSDFMKGTAFAIFEMLAVNKKYSKGDKSGKTYKEGLFSVINKNFQCNLGLLKRYFQLYLREGVRHYYYDEIMSSDNISLNNPLGNDESEATEFINLLPETIIFEEEFSQEELFEIARGCSNKIFEAMSFTHRALILALSLELPYSTSEALGKVTGLSKSALGEHLQKITQQKYYIGVIKKDFLNEPSEIIQELYAFSMHLIVTEKIISWGKAEIRCAPLFKESEKQFVGGGKL
ncbi:MAG: hypothetical protein ACOX2F_02835 [bacterium]